MMWLEGKVGTVRKAGACPGVVRLVIVAIVDALANSTSPPKIQPSNFHTFFFFPSHIPLAIASSAYKRELGSW